MTASARRAFPPAPHAARALLLRAHPLPTSFNAALADAWRDGAISTGVTVDELDVAGLDFDPILHVAYTDDQPLEPDLVALQQRIAQAAHLTIAWPVWWGSTPAHLKGLIDRTFLPGWAFDMGDRGLPVGGLTGRSGRLIFTMDSPSWWDRLVYGRSTRRQLKNATLQFCGVKPVGVSGFHGIGKSTAAQREKMLLRSHRAGQADGQAILRRFPAPAAPRYREITTQE